MKTVYACEICDQTFVHEEDALACESRHYTTDNMTIVSFEYMCGSAYPSSVLIKFSGGGLSFERSYILRR